MLIQRLKLLYSDVEFREVIQKGSQSLGVKCATALVSFLFHLSIARILGPEQTGTYYLALTVYWAGVVVGKFGLDHYVLKYSSISEADNDSRLSASIAITSLFALILSLIVFLSADVVSTYVFQDNNLPQTLRLISFAILPSILLHVLSRIIQGFKAVFFAFIFMEFMVPTLALLLIFFFVEFLNSEIVSIVYSFSAAIALIACVYFVSKNNIVKLSRLDLNLVILTVKSGFPFFCTSLMVYISNWYGSFISGFFLDSSQVGIYGVATRIALLLSFFLFAADSILAPKFSSMYKGGRLKDIESIARKTIKLTIILAIIPASIVFIIPEIVLGLFGTEFQAGKFVLMILCLAQLINIGTGSVGFLLLMTGNELLFRNVLIVSTLFYVFFGYFLTAQLGVIGTAWAHLGQIVVQNSLALYIAYRKLGIWILPTFIKRNSA